MLAELVQAVMLEVHASTVLAAAGIVAAVAELDAASLLAAARVSVFGLVAALAAAVAAISSRQSMRGASDRLRECARDCAAASLLASPRRFTMLQARRSSEHLNCLQRAGTSPTRRDKASVQSTGLQRDTLYRTQIQGHKHTRV